MQYVSKAAQHCMLKTAVLRELTLRRMLKTSLSGKTGLVPHTGDNACEKMYL